MEKKMQDLNMNELLRRLRRQQFVTPKQQEAIVDEIERRVQLLAINRKQIAERLAAYEGDERGHYPVATVFENAPLALIQVKLETGKQELKWVLKLLDDKGDEQ